MVATASEERALSIARPPMDRALGVVAELFSPDGEIDGSHSSSAWYCGFVNWHFYLAALLLPTITSCSKSDADIRVWRPNDHDQAPEQASSGQPMFSGSAALAEVPQKNSNLVQSTWDSLCTGCHGRAGDGSGPMGGSIGARNLSDPAWLASTTDEQMANSILHGKGRMPAFSLDSETLHGLVRLIRGRTGVNSDRTIKP